MKTDRTNCRNRNRTTMVDVAQLAGVSQQTVSRVLNGSCKVTPDTIERVSRAIDMLGYKRNSAARSLVTNQSMRLGVVHFGINQFGPASTLFGIVETARKHHYSTNLVSLADFNFKSLLAAVDQLQEDNVDGIIVLAPVSGAAVLDEILSDKVPVVRFEPGLDNGTTSISVDEVAGARLASRHLLELGHRMVMHVSGPSGWLGTEARIAGWQQELHAAGLATPEAIAGDWSAQSGYVAGLKLLEQDGVSSVFVANDQMALGVIKALHDRGVAVPGDISVVGFDDIPEAEFFNPALTTIKLNFLEVGQRCVTRLLEIIAGHDLEWQPAIPPELIVRSSTGPCPQLVTAEPGHRASGKRA